MYILIFSFPGNDLTSAFRNKTRYLTFYGTNERSLPAQLFENNLMCLLLNFTRHLLCNKISLQNVFC